MLSTAWWPSGHPTGPPERASSAAWIKLRSVHSTYGSLVAAVVVTVGIAAQAITGEFATGSIRTTVAATPSRWAVLTAKAAVVGALTSLLVVGLGAILRSAAGTITTAVAVLFAPPILLGAWAVGTLAAGMIALHRRDP